MNGNRVWKYLASCSGYGVLCVWVKRGSNSSRRGAEGAESAEHGADWYPQAVSVFICDICR